MAAAKKTNQRTRIIKGFLEELRKNLPADFCAEGDIYVFVDENYRTQSGELHKAMEASTLALKLFVGFTGTPLLKADKQKSIEVFGGYIHTTSLMRPLRMA